jgi:UDP-N-acetylglucosamine enolpyruvyl transferase
MFPVSDGNTMINAVKKIDGGYEILKKNVKKNGTWYEK